ncbi:MAG: ACT domain-containing protein [Selenomonadaceae bacterium]|nr:ACT domain-containing protein [Selenomonadaceae bacterium]
MSVKQISVFLENKPGTLKKLTGLLTDNNINIRALSVVDTKDFGIVRMLVDDVYATTSVLSDNHFIASLNSVLVVAIPDEVGGLDKLLTNFEQAEINIEYMYAFAGKKGAYMIFRVGDTKKAEAAFARLGLASLSSEDMAEV